MSIAYNTQNSLSQVSLWEAAGANNGSKTDINRLRELLAQGEDINQPNWAGCTPLHCAAPEGNVEVLKFLLDYRADCNRTTPYGLTPLHFASYYGRLDNVKLLLNYGANASTRTHDGFTPKDKAVEGQKNARGKPQDGLRHAEVIDLLSAWENQGRIPQTTSIPLTSSAQHVQPPTSTDYFATFVRSLESVINKHRQTQSAVYGRQKDDDFKVFLQEISNLVQTYHQATQQQPQQTQPQIQQPIHSFQPPVTNENAWGINGPQSLVASSLHRPPSTPQIQPTGTQPPRNQQVNPQRPPQSAPPTTPITNNLPPTKPSVPPRNPASTPGPGAIVPYENPNQPNMTTPDYYTQQYHAFLENIKAGPRGGTVFAGDYYNQGGQSARVFPHTNNSAYAQYSPAGPARTQAPTWINQSYTPPQSSFGFPSAPSYQNFAYSQYAMPGLQGMQGMGLQATPQRF